MKVKKPKTQIINVPLRACASVDVRLTTLSRGRVLPTAVWSERSGCYLQIDSLSYKMQAMLLPRIAPAFMEHEKTMNRSMAFA
jgi:hypothetical protein